MKKILFRLASTSILLVLVFNVLLAQTTTFIIQDNTKLTFTASTDHNTLFSGTPVLMSYVIEVFLKANTSGTGTPTFTVDIGKPTPTVTNAIVTPNIKTLFPFLPNTEYILFVKANGPGGSSRSATSSSPFGFPAAPVAVTGNLGFQP